MPRTQIPIPFGFYTSDSLPFSAQRCVNWIPTVAEGGALNNRKLSQVLGLKTFVSTDFSGGRGALKMDGVPYFVNENSLISVSKIGIVTNHGAIAGNGRVSMATNGTKLVVVVPGSSAYVYDLKAGSLQQITDPDYILSDTVVFKDGYFVFTATDGSVFINSALNDPLNFNALDFATAEANSDRIVAAHVNHNELFILGLDSIELYQNVATEFGSPFQRIPGAYIQKGCHAKFSIVDFDNSFCFVGGESNEKSAVWKVTGSSSTIKISTDVIDKEIQKFTEDEIANCFAMTYADKGQLIAVFTFISDRIPSRTFCYNATASAAGGSVWFELQTGVTDNAWQVAAIVKAYGKLLVSDLSLSGIGELDGDTYDYYGDEIYRECTTQPFSQNGFPVFAGELEATFGSGVGLTLGQGSDPVVRYSFSDDGGRTFSSEFSRSIGKIGEYEQRSIWRRQGRFSVSRSVRFTITDPVKADLIRIAATPELGTQ